MNFKHVLLLIPIVLILVNVNESFAESTSFTVAARNYSDFPILLNKGDEISFSVYVNGGANDDVEFTIYYPDGSNDGGGRVYENFDGQLVAKASGTYTFRFDNTYSTISNKSIDFSYQITKNSYYVHADELPDYAKNYAGSAAYDGTQYWVDVFPNLNFYQAESQSDADIMIQWVKDFTGVKHVGFQYERLIEIGLGDSNCRGEWKPYSSEHIKQIMTHELGHAIGLEHSSDPSSIMYPTASRTQYGVIEESYVLGKGYVQFVSFCSSTDITSFSYDVSTDDPTHGFDVYVVPSINEFDKAIKGESFDYYSFSECYGENYLSYSGTCSGISQNSGVLIVVDNRQTNGLTNLTVKQLEINQDVNRLQSTSSTTISYEYPDEYTENQKTLEDAFSQAQESLDKYQQSEAEKQSLEFKLSQAKSDAEKKIDAIATAYEKKNVNRNLIDSFDAQISYVVNSLTGISYENQQAQEKIEQAWEEKGKAESDLKNAEKKWVLGDRSLTNKDEYKASLYFDEIQSIIESGQEHLNLSALLFDDAKNIVLNQKPKIACGKGTIEKDGICTILITEESQSKGGGCLIATATYGSELAPQVQQLRELRDSKLLQTESGTSFMTGFNQFYYSFSPIVADWERENPAFKEVVKISLTPMISSLSILNYVDMDSESKVLGYGISLIMLNGMMYVGLPIIGVISLRKVIN